MTPAECNAIEWEGEPPPSYDPAPEPTWAEQRDSLIESRDDALDQIEELKQQLADAEATIEQLRGSLARTQTWLTEAGVENAELRTKVHERDVWLNAAAGTIERYGAKFGPLSEL